MAQLNGIDISSWQSDMDVYNVDADFVIVKVSGGVSYVNPYWKQQADDALQSGKLLGLYHYACEYDSEPGGKAEAEYFLDQIGDYLYKAILILDWENHALNMPVSYAKEWLDTVAERTGTTPIFYGYAANVNTTDYSSIAHYPLWMASYLDRYTYGYGYIDSPDNTWDTGNWDNMIMYQYSSTRKIPGYIGYIDVNAFYGTREDWLMLANGSAVPVPSPEPAPVPEGQPKYCVQVSNGWLPPMVGTYDTGGSSDDYAGIMGSDIAYLAIEGVGKYRVCTQASGWLPWVDAYDTSDYEYGCAGDGSPILAVEIPNPAIRYAVHINGGDWYPDMIGNYDVGGSSDIFAGDEVRAIDAIRIQKA